MSKPHITPSPRRLLDLSRTGEQGKPSRTGEQGKPSRTGEQEKPYADIAALIARSEQLAPPPTDADRAWRQLQARRATRRRAWALAPIAVGAAVLAIVLARQAGPNSGRTVSTPEAIGEHETAEQRGAIRVVRVEGRITLGNGDERSSVIRRGAELPAGAVLVASASSAIELDVTGVAPRAVRVRAYEVQMFAASVAIATDSERISVSVRRGQVALTGPGVALRIPPGSCWSSQDGRVQPCRDEGELARAAPEAPASPVVRDDRAGQAIAERPAPKSRQARSRRAPADRSPLTRAADLVGQGRHRQAIAVLDAAARGRTRSAELALYEIGRIKHRDLNDLDGALTSFEAYRARFADGGLRQEVDLNVIEIQVARNKHARALAEIDGFLARHPSSERRAEVLLHKAHLLRKRGDHAAAAASYDAARDRANLPRVVADALYFSAVCLSELGDVAAARARLRDYLSKFPAGRHADSAREALGE